MDKLLDGFVKYIKKENLFQRNDKLLLAVSGGVDSVVLCHLCKEAQYDFAIAHCNFQLRDEESNRDEVFVADLAKKYDVPLFTTKFETLEHASKKKVSVQVAARMLRYEYFSEIISQNYEADIKSRSKRHILTAHHADDNIETVLMNFFKGTGISGIRGILPSQGYIKRPLLFANKKDLMHFALLNQLSYVEDSSNESIKYTRNYFRQVLIPSIEKIFPQVNTNLQDNIERFREIEILFNESINLHRKQLVKKITNDEIHLPVRILLKTEALFTILLKLLEPYSFNVGQISEVIKLLNAETGKYIQSTTHRILRNREWLIITPLETQFAANILIDENKSIIRFDNLSMKFSTHINKADFISSNENIACIDKDRVTFPFILRKWKTGDYFYPLGMDKKKKLSKFFIDSKLSIADKEKVWVLESDKRIVWVVGIRIDNRFKVTEKTKEVLKIQLY